MRQLANHPLFGDPEVSICIPVNDRALFVVLRPGYSTMVRTFPADNVSIHITFIAINIVTVMNRGTADYDLFLTAPGDASSFVVDIHLMVANFANPFQSRGFHLVGACVEIIDEEVLSKPMSVLSWILGSFRVYRSLTPRSDSIYIECKLIVDVDVVHFRAKTYGLSTMRSEDRTRRVRDSGII